MMWWAVWCAVVAAGCAGAAAAPAPDIIDLVQIDPPTADEGPVGYAVPAIDGRYPSDGPWYFLSELPRNSQSGSERIKRRMPSLSIDLPMSVLRQKLSLEKERKLHAIQAAANRNYLNDIGKRAFQWAPLEQADKFY